METTNSIDCGPGCDCGKPSGHTKAKIVVCLAVLLAIGSIFAYKTANGKQAVPADNAVAGFIAPIAEPANESEPAVSSVPDDLEKPAVTSAVENFILGDTLDSLASLNTRAVDQDAVLIFVPARGNEPVKKEVTEAIASAQHKIRTAGVNLGLYTLTTDSPDYANVSAQLPLPGMLILSKGRGMGVVPGEITETKILQAYMASTQAGGCGPSGCGPSGC